MEAAISPSELFRSIVVFYPLPFPSSRAKASTHGTRNGNGREADRATCRQEVPRAGLSADQQDVNLSGRFLRRMPIMACARYLSSHSSHSSISSGNGGGRNSPSRSPEKWLEAMKRIVEDERGDREKIGWDRRDAEVEVGSVSAAANGGEGRGKGGMKANGDVPMVQKEEVGVATATKSQVAGGP